LHPCGCRRPDVQMFRCADVQMYRCADVQMFGYANVATTVPAQITTAFGYLPYRRNYRISNHQRSAATFYLRLAVNCTKAIDFTHGSDLGTTFSSRQLGSTKYVSVSSCPRGHLRKYGRFRYLGCRQHAAQAAARVANGTSRGHQRDESDQFVARR
jgi:hypothetical protein